MTNYTYEAIQKTSEIHDWEFGELSWQKAYVASLFAKGAYDYIPEFEFENDNRAQVIPCWDYRENLQEHRSLLRKERSQSYDEYEIDSFVTDLVVVTISRTTSRNLVFIAIRGTTNSFDVFTDLKAVKVHVPSDKRALTKYHRGVFQGVVSCEKAIWERVKRIASEVGKPLRVYFTGHSLGGAIASILYARFCKMTAVYLYDHPYWPRKYAPYWTEAVSCYTFGMPRYGNVYAVLDRSTPFDIYNEKDPIPALPPRFMGYADSLDNYCISRDAKLVTGHRKGDIWLSTKGKRIRLLAFSEHSAEYYVEQMKLASENGII